MRAEKRRDSFFTQWAAQFFVGAELTRRGYCVAFPLGNAPATDVQVTSPRGESFPVEVKGLRTPNWWLVRRPNPRRRCFYVLVHVPRTEPFETPRYFVLTNEEVLSIHRDDPTWPGMNWGAVRPYENRWESLPK